MFDNAGVPGDEPPDHDELGDQEDLSDQDEPNRSIAGSQEATDHLPSPDLADRETNAPPHADTGDEPPLSTFATAVEEQPGAGTAAALAEEVSRLPDDDLVRMAVT